MTGGSIGFVSRRPRGAGPLAAAHVAHGAGGRRGANFAHFKVWKGPDADQPHRAQYEKLVRA